MALFPSEEQFFGGDSAIHEDSNERKRSPLAGSPGKRSPFLFPEEPGGNRERVATSCGRAGGDHTGVR
jgi:hypothetical protein